MKVSYEKEGRDMTYVHRETLVANLRCQRPGCELQCTKPQARTREGKQGTVVPSRVRPAEKRRCAASCKARIENREVP